MIVDLHLFCALILLISLISVNYVADIGIDWADRKHDIALYDCASKSWQESIIKTRPQDVLDWVNQLRDRHSVVGTGHELATG